ncbi:hypothetical protein [Rhodopirellula sallentina]|uniref:hypothetical protein n=1 Tax=Rhodopirellula sallentina TaxID=1263869 RepID=UPI000348C6EA|nr:hypothetical protein [Rhodopirellula sallentina]
MSNAEFKHLSSKLDLVVDDRAVFQVEADDGCFFNYSSGVFADGSEHNGSVVLEPHMRSKVEEWLIGRHEPEPASLSDSPLEQFQADEENDHKLQGNPKVQLNALYKTRDNINAQLTATQAIQLAQHLLQKAQIIIDNELSDATVHLWNQGSENETFYCGLTKARKGPRREKKD